MVLENVAAQGFGLIQFPGLRQQRDLRQFFVNGPLGARGAVKGRARRFSPTAPRSQLAI
jgi:hypothetical protein